MIRWQIKGFRFAIHLIYCNFAEIMSTKAIRNLEYNPAGLTDVQIAESRQRHGENVLTPPPSTSLWKLYLDKYRDPIIQILLVAAAISLVLSLIEQDFIETIGIFVAIFLAASRSK